MNLTQLEMHGVQYARERRSEADTARLFAQAPRNRSPFRFVARTMRGLARRLATAAERIDPAPAERAATFDAAAWRPTRHAA